MASGPELVEESRVGGGLGAVGFWRMRGREDERGCSTVSGCQLAHISGGEGADRLLASPCLTLHSRQIQSTGTGVNHVHDHISTVCCR